jgi:carboxyl-terminal processing protease
VYSASRGEVGPKYPVVVLVNRGTASAAEIVSGALQDHDRALIAGETTFGKGLVQTVFNVSENTGLALTTFHYYTPSGRLIQRPYDKMSLYDYYYVRDAANPKDNANREVKLTDDGRTVYGGGGITPDELIKSPVFNHFQIALMGTNSIGNLNSPSITFARLYFAKHGSITKDFVVDDSVLSEYKVFLHNRKVEFTDKDFEANTEWLKAFIRVDLINLQFGQAEAQRARAEWDPEVQKALTFLPQAQALLDQSKNKTVTASAKK